MCELSYMIIFCLFKSFVLWLRRSGLLTFFSSLVIQESLINCANERLRSRIFSHCENILSFCLSASHPWSWTRAHILFLVELAIAEMACVSRNIRGTFHVPSGVPVQRSISERDCSHPIWYTACHLLTQMLYLQWWFLLLKLRRLFHLLFHQQLDIRRLFSQLVHYILSFFLLL